MSTVRVTLLAAALCLACSSDGLVTTASVPLDSTGLVQQVSLSAATVTVGDSIVVHSVIRNIGTRQDTIQIGEIGGCGTTGLAFSGVAFVARPDTLPCAGLIGTFAMAPGDSDLAYAVTPPIAAPPGDYLLTIQQVWLPKVAARVRIHVVARATN